MNDYHAQHHHKYDQDAVCSRNVANWAFMNLTLLTNIAQSYLPHGAMTGYLIHLVRTAQMLIELVEFFYPSLLQVLYSHSLFQTIYKSECNHQHILNKILWPTAHPKQFGTPHHFQPTFASNYKPLRFIIFLQEMKKRQQRDASPDNKKVRRSASPIATPEELEKKRIQLIIYVGNLPLSWNDDDIKEYFSQYGKIIESRLIQKMGAFTGSALVKFESLSDAENAIEKLQNKTIMGSERKVNIKWLDTEQQRLGIGQKDDHKLFVGSLPRQANVKTLYDVFSIFGKVNSVRLQENQYWAFIEYEKKESALLAIKHLHGQTYLHGSRIPIQVRFKEKKYNSFMSKKHAQQDLDPFAYSVSNLYHIVFDNETGIQYFYNYQTGKSQYEPPPPGAKVLCTVGDVNKSYIQQEVNTLNDMQSQAKKFGPAGSNLFLFHLPNSMKDSELYNLFKKFGPILSTRVMTEKNGKSKGIGFVSFDNPKSAAEAIEEMNGFEIRGKRLKVELNKKDEKAINANSLSLNQVNYEV